MPLTVDDMIDDDAIDAARSPASCSWVGVRGTCAATGRAGRRAHAPPTLPLPLRPQPIDTRRSDRSGKVTLSQRRSSADMSDCDGRSIVTDVFSGRLSHSRAVFFFVSV